ncbi:hypothetical protein ABPG75_001785 [Micractinium tetrahymenae]
MPPRPSTGASGIRGAYETYGVQGFYEAHGQEYSNPHNDQIVKAVAALMSSRQFGKQPGGRLRVLDLACGSGEATLALQAWASSVQPEQQPHRQQQDVQQPPPPVPEHLQKEAAPAPGRRQRGQSRAAGSTACPSAGLLDITACDPYTHEAYHRRTGSTAHRWSFQDIADGCLAGRSFDLCVCSFALHLCDPSSLFITLYQLACHCRWLAVLAPHKQPAGIDPYV